MSGGAGGAALLAPHRLLDLLRAWSALGGLRPIDHAFAEFLHEQVPDASPLLLLAAALASQQSGRGHVCLDLAEVLADPDSLLSLPPNTGPVSGPTRLAEVLDGVRLDDWKAALSDPRALAAGDGDTPLVLSGGRLYLRRFWECERFVAGAIRSRVNGSADLRARLDVRLMRAWLDRLFGPVQAAETDWQRVACALAAGANFAVITGGPGTGKTTTVVRLLALLQALHLESNAPVPLRIGMAAPTGKAAARLNAAVGGAVQGLPLAEDATGARIRAAIPVAVSTVHRLLGSRPGTRHFRHGPGNPLPLDVLVVDEASMIDLELMTSVLQALSPQARLIVLGDRDQLASVEAGAVLGEVCARAGRGHYTARTVAWLRAVSGERIPDGMLDEDGQELDQHIVMLRRSFRFGRAGAIGRLAEAVNGGDPDAARAILARGEALPDLASVHLGASGADLELGLLTGSHGRSRPEPGGGMPVGLAQHLRGMTDTDPGDAADADALQRWAAGVLQAQGQFQLLCAVRGGPWGVESLNRRVEAALRRAGLITVRGAWYPGRPVMVRVNDYALGLMNGDIGVTLSVPGPDADGIPRRMLRVAFPAADGSGRVRWLPPSRLSRVETVYAMTVHKAQGSEFEHVALLLPDRESAVLTRELLYTAITRARRRFTLLETAPGVLEQAIGRRVTRSSGLGDALRGPGVARAS